MDKSTDFCRDLLISKNWMTSSTRFRRKNNYRFYYLKKSWFFDNNSVTICTMAIKSQNYRPGKNYDFWHFCHKINFWDKIIISKHSPRRAFLANAWIVDLQPLRLYAMKQIGISHSNLQKLAFIQWTSIPLNTNAHESNQNVHFH